MDGMDDYLTVPILRKGKSLEQTGGDLTSATRCVHVDTRPLRDSERREVLTGNASMKTFYYLYVFECK